ncbi:unnamed protein product [Bemisia tabaci]|uniref:Uncharacterized protein n=1 Tax=Bemisia tabaci TaxID=7038 RepID=A0A9P0A1W8_BEMTA|nr:unnamed protein product [Bemisia tabaci]
MSMYETLALTLDLDLSERKYDVLKNYVNRVHAGLMPTLYSLNNFKKQFYPKIMYASDTQVQVDAQDMLNKTINSLFLMLEEEILKNYCSSSEFVVVFKWGMDGSSGHSTYKLPFRDESNIDQETVQNTDQESDHETDSETDQETGQNTEKDPISQTDEFLFFIAFLPIFVKEKQSGSIVWRNPRPSSPHYCRPLKFMFCKENKDITLQEYKRFDDLFKNAIEKCDVNINNKFVNVESEFHFTMIDGKVCDIVSGTNSCSVCVICKAKPTAMNSLDVEKFIPNKENYKYGLSTLHCWIRFLECCLKIAFRLQVEEWKETEQYKALKKTKTKEDKREIQIIGKKLKADTKKRIQQEMKVSLGLNISKPKQGFGSSNDGNTARTFFQKHEITSNITGLDHQLLVNFHVILRLLNCKEDLNLEKFDELTKETLSLYMAKYQWYKLPQTVHKILIHGSEVMRNFDFPVAFLAEDALEATHKDIRSERDGRTRKRSRVESNIDLMNRLALKSDPHVTSFRCSALKKKKK